MPYKFNPFTGTLDQVADLSSYATTASVAAGYQPLDSDLTAIAALSPSNNQTLQYISGAWAMRSAAQVRTTLGLVIGTNVQAWDADLDTWATKTAPSGTVVGDTDSQTLTNKTISGSSNTLSNIGNSSLTNSAITIAGSSTSLGGSITQDTITGLSSTGIIKRTGSNTLAVATAGTDYIYPSGVSGGQTLIGGLLDSEHLTLQANDETFDNEKTGRIKIRNQMVWEDNFNLNSTFGGFFTSGNWALIQNTPVITLENGMNAGGAVVVSNSHTIRYSNTQAYTSAPTFISMGKIQPTTAVNDGAAVLWSGFQSIDKFEPDLATGITATTMHFQSFVGAPGVGIKTGSHASAVAAVTNLTAYHAFSSIYNAAFAQAQVTTARGLWVHTPSTSGSGTITNTVGVEVDAMTTGGTSNIGVRIAKANTYSLQLSDTSSSSAGGITFGTDTNLYRSAANTLKTDDALDANSYKVAGTAGATGTFTTADSKTVTVTSGIIVSIV